MLKSKRLVLRSITINDADAIFDYSKEKNVGPNAGWKPHESIEETIEIMHRVFINQADVFAIINQEDQKLIGSIGLIFDPKRENEQAKMIGYAMSERYWGKGLMTEAVKEIISYGFDILNLDLISAYCYSHNIASKKVIEKCGFSYEGRLRACEKVYNGTVFDNECYSLLKTEC